VIVIDTSLWIAAYRDQTRGVASAITTAAGSEDVRTIPFVVTELLQGARTETEWSKLSESIKKFPTLDVPATIWIDAARIFFDLQRSALTVRSTLDCLIAQMCLTHDCVLLHNDRDFERIATVRPLKQLRVDVS
jgi:predicted nucleic acid-binding protein